jgi:hypothetical protein
MERIIDNQYDIGNLNRMVVFFNEFDHFIDDHYTGEHQ